MSTHIYMDVETALLAPFAIITLQDCQNCISEGGLYRLVAIQLE